MAEKEAGKKMKTPKIMPRENSWSPAKYDVEQVQLKDYEDDEDQEDKNIQESIKMAEKETGKKMKTPKIMPKEHAWAPAKYDVEEVQIKDYEDDEDQEDKNIQESIKMAEKELGKKMKNPKIMPRENAWSPAKFDVEELSQEND